jgi:hypothetical protein
MGYGNSSNRRRFLEVMWKSALAGTAGVLGSGRLAAQFAAPKNVRLNSRALISPSDLAWLGQAFVPPIGSATAPHGGTSYMGPAMGVRYINGVRHLYTVNYQPYNPSNAYMDAGDLVEWRFPTLYRGPVSGALSMIPTGRVWTNWPAYPSQITNACNVSTGVRIGSLWFDKINPNVMWYTFYGYYAGDNMPFLGAVTLNDNGTTTPHGLWFFRSNTTRPVGNSQTYWKGVGGWVIGIPAYAQAALGKMGIGAPALGTIGSYGNFGPGLRTLPDFPALTDPAGTALTAFKRILDYSQEYGPSSGWAMRRNPNYTSMHGTDPLSAYATYIGGSYTGFNTYTPGGFGGAVPGGNGDAIYFSFGGEKSLNLCLHMDVPSSGASRVWEYFNGRQWVSLNPTFNVGSANLDASVVNGYWVTPSNWAQTAVAGITGYFMRIRNLATATTGGTMNCTDALPNHATVIPPGHDRQPPSNGKGYWQASRDNVETFIWVDTGTKHGVLCFGRQLQGRSWYGPYPSYSSSNGIDCNTFLQERREPSGGNGYHTDADEARLYLFDPDQLIEVGNGKRVGNNTGINPVAEVNWNSYWPNIPNTVSGAEWVSAYQGNGGFFDAATNQIIWVHPHSHRSGYSETPTVQVFQVT